MTYICKYCTKSFVRESTLAVHVCEQKRRHQTQGEPGDRLGLMAYLRFYELTQGQGKTKTFDDFASSPYYKAFIKYGRYCIDTRVINPSRMIEWLLKNNKKIDNWCSDKIYTEYLLEHLRVENVSDALSRAVEYSMNWTEKTEHPAHDCLRYGNTNAVCHAIVTGRISAWVIYNSDSGQKFLSELNPEQVAMIWSYIDADIWNQKFRDLPEDRKYAQEILTQAGW
jgi:hypothetical protein